MPSSCECGLARAPRAQRTATAHCEELVSSLVHIFEDRDSPHLLRRVQEIDIALVLVDALGERLDAGQLGAAGVQSSCRRERLSA